MQTTTRSFMSPRIAVHRTAFRRCAVAMFVAVFFSLTFAYGQQPDNGDPYGTVDRGVSAMIAEVLKEGYL